MKDMSYPWPHNCSWHLIPNMCKLLHSSMNRSVSITSCPWWGYLEDIDGSWLETWRTRVIIDLIIILDIWFQTCVPNCCILAGLKICQEPPCHHQCLGGHWGFLNGDIEDMGHPWSHNCFGFCISNPCAKFQPSSMIKSVSRTTLSSSVTWRMLRVSDRRHGGHGSSLTS